MTSLALCTALCPEKWDVLESRRWGDDAVMTKREHDECRRRHAEAALEYVIGKLSKADEATALPPAKKLVTPPSSVCDLDEIVDVDELVAPESAIVSTTGFDARPRSRRRPPVGVVLEVAGRVRVDYGRLVAGSARRAG